MGPPSGLSDLAKQEFAEDSREDEESSDVSVDEEEKARRWRLENVYYYKCPVFRVSNYILSLCLPLWLTFGLKSVTVFNLNLI